MRIDNVQFNAELTDILSELQKVLTANGIMLLQKTKDAGDDIMVQCPYHANGQEHKPSAGIRKEDGMFHCFACGETHALYEVISNCFGKNDGGAYGWQWLLKNFGTVRVEERKDVELDFNRRTSNSGVHSTRSPAQSFVTEEELDKYRYIHPYMYKRRLTDEIIELFDIGYDSDTNCITFPVRDIDGNCLFVARRSVATKYFNYPKGVEKPLYGLYELMKFQYERNGIQEVIVCESMLDALTCWVYGKYAVALNGLGNDLQFKQLRELPCRKIILATDNDERGMSARIRIRKKIEDVKLVTEYILPSSKKDINELEKSEFDTLLEIF